MLLLVLIISITRLKSSVEACGSALDQLLLQPLQASQIIIVAFESDCARHPTQIHRMVLRERSAAPDLYNGSRLPVPNALPYVRHVSSLADPVTRSAALAIFGSAAALLLTSLFIWRRAKHDIPGTVLFLLSAVLWQTSAT